MNTPVFLWNRELQSIKSRNTQWYKWLISPTTKAAVGKQIIYLSLAKAGHSSGILFIHIGVKITKLDNVILPLFRSHSFPFQWFSKIPSPIYSTLEYLYIDTKHFNVWLTFSKWERFLSLIHIWRCRRSTLCRSRWSPYH